MQPSSEHESSPSSTEPALRGSAPVLPPREQRREQHERDRKLDADRIASMADEGGRTGARMELREQLVDDLEPVRLRKPNHRALIYGVLGLAGGLAAALVIPRLHLSWR